MKRTIEINDTLQERVDSAIEQVKEELENYLNDNPDTDELPCLNNDSDYSGVINNIIDSAVPVYPAEIKAIMYLYGDDVEQAFEEAEVGERNDDEWPDGWKAGAIYLYIKQQVDEWYSENANAIFETWKDDKA